MRMVSDSNDHYQEGHLVMKNFTTIACHVENDC